MVLLLTCVELLQFVKTFYVVMIGLKNSLTRLKLSYLDKFKIKHFKKPDALTISRETTAPQTQGMAYRLQSL